MINLFFHRTNTDWEKAAKLSFIENQINIAKSINSAVEFEHWYGILGLHLAEHGTEAKVRMLLDQLVGVPSGLNNSHASNQANDKYLVSFTNPSAIIIFNKICLFFFRESQSNGCFANCYPAFRRRRGGNASTLNIQSN